MINEINVINLVKKNVNANNELSYDTFCDLTDLLEESDVEKVLSILDYNGITLVNGSVEATAAYVDSSELMALTNEQLCVLYQRGSEDALDALTNKNYKLLYSVASKLIWSYKPDMLTVEDLMVEGWFGLRKAAEKFDAGLGFKFTTYAMWWIRQTIIREIMNNGNRVRIPVHIYEDIIRMNWCRQVLCGGTVAEICDMLNSKYDKEYTIDCVKKLMHFADTYLSNPSLNTLVGDDGRSEIIDFVRSEYSVEDEVAASMMPEIVKECLSILSDREREVIHLRFGFDNNVPMTLEEVGNRLGVTRERIRQIETRAIAKLRRYSKITKLEGMYAA